MKIWGVPKSELETIARDLGFRLENVREGGVKVTWVAFTLRMAVPAPSKADRAWRERADTRKLTPAEDRRYHEIVRAEQYRARSPMSLAIGKPRWAGAAVCWHGHKAFLDRVVGNHPAVRFESKLWRFTGAEEYASKVDSTGMINMGSAFRPVQTREACDCAGG